MRILVTRPQPDAAAFAAVLAARGIDSMQEPLLDVRFGISALPALEGVQAVLLTSANGARALRAACAGGLPPALSGLPAWAVGAASAQAAAEAGFAAVRHADGDAAALAAAVAEALSPAAGALLHVRAQHVAGDLSGALERRGFVIRPALLYATQPRPALSPAVQRALRNGSLDGVALFSPRTAKAFARLLASAGLDGHAGEIDAFCLSRAVAGAAAAGLAWRDVHVAQAPRSEVLADLVAATAARGNRLQGVRT